MTNKYCIVVPVYEKKKFLNFLKSKKLISDNDNFEIIIVNDGNSYDFKDITNWDNNKFHLIDNQKILDMGLQ